MGSLSSLHSAAPMARRLQRAPSREDRLGSAGPSSASGQPCAFSASPVDGFPSLLSKQMMPRIVGQKDMGYIP